MSTLADAGCPLCGTITSRKEKVTDVSAFDIDCPRCGIYRIGGATLATLKSLRDEAFIRGHIPRIKTANSKGLLYHFPAGTVTSGHHWLPALHDIAPSSHSTRIEDGTVEESQHWDSDILEHSGLATSTGLNSRQRVPDTEPLAQLLMVMHGAGDLSTLGAHIRQPGATLGLIQEAIRVYDGTAELQARLAPQNRSYTWLALGSLPLDEQGPVFAYRIAEALRDVGAVGLLAETPRQHLNNLLFQPLQNALAYGWTKRTAAQQRPFAGLVLRVVDASVLAGASKNAYKKALSPDRATAGFLEAIVHDDGPGIAAHFFAAHQKSQGSLYERDLAWEWTALQHAFERHLSSRPRYLERRINQQAFEPGIGLFAVLNALKVLDGYMEVRCGRLRLYRFLLNDVHFRVDEPLLHPSHFQEKPAPLISGTLLRFLLPLDTAQA